MHKNKQSGSVTNPDQKGEILGVKKVRVQSLLQSPHSLSQVKPIIKEDLSPRRAPQSHTPVGPPVQVPKDAIQTICNYEGIKVINLTHQIQYPLLSSGSSEERRGLLWSDLREE